MPCRPLLELLFVERVDILVEPGLFEPVQVEINRDILGIQEVAPVLEVLGNLHEVVFGLLRIIVPRFVACVLEDDDKLGLGANRLHGTLPQDAKRRSVQTFERFPPNVVFIHISGGLRLELDEVGLLVWRQVKRVRRFELLPFMRPLYVALG